MKLFKAGLIGLAIFALLGVLAYRFLLPWIIRGQIETALGDMGLSNVSFDIRRATLWETTMTDVVIGRDHATRVASAVMSYSPATLWQGRLDSVRLSGIEFIVVSQDGSLDVGPWMQVQAKESAEPMTDLPLDRVELVSCTLVLQSGEDQMRVPFEGSLIKSHGVGYKINLKMDSQSKPLVVQGTYNPRNNSVDLHAAADALSTEFLLSLAKQVSPTLELGSRGELGLEAHFTLAAGKGHFSAQIRPDLISLAMPPTGRRPGTNLHVPEGVLQVDANLEANIEPQIRLVLKNLGFSTENPVLSASGIFGEIVIDRLNPISTQPATLSIASATLGDAELTGGTLPFEIDGPHSIALGQTSWNVLGGTLTTSPVTFDPSDPAMDLKIAAQRVRLDELLERFAEDKAVGSGRIDARVVVRIDGPEVSITDGLLLAEGGGTFKVLDTEAIAQTLTEVDKRRPRQADEPDLSARVVEAMKDFKYDVLKAELKQEPEGLVIYMQIVGKGQAGMKQALNYEPTIRGAGPIVAGYLGFSEWLSEVQGNAKAANP